MKTKFKTVALAGFAALALAGMVPVTAHAQPAPTQQTHRPRQHRNIEQRVDRLLTRVGASADQKTKVHAIMDAAKTDLAPMRAAMRDSRKQMRTLLTAPQIDTAAIETLRVQTSATMDKISQRMTQAMIDGANVLTPDQRARLGTMHMGPHTGPNHQQ